MVVDVTKVGKNDPNFMVFNFVRVCFCEQGKIVPEGSKCRTNLQDMVDILHSISAVCGGEHAHPRLIARPVATQRLRVVPTGQHDRLHSCHGHICWGGACGDPYWVWSGQGHEGRPK